MRTKVVREVNGGVAKDTLQGPLVDQPLARSGRYYTPNHLGSTTTLTDGAGSTVQSYTYGPFGETTASTGEANPFEYAGREADESGLYYNRARYYRPEWGRFISEDPIGLLGGLNQYAYAGNNPFNALDPSGMDWLNNASSFFGGWGDALSFGGTGWVRRLLGVDDQVEYGSGWYIGGEIIGTLHMTLLMDGYNGELGPGPAVGEEEVPVYRGFREPQLGSIQESGGVIGSPPGGVTDPRLFVTPDQTYAGLYGDVYQTMVPKRLFQQARDVFGLYQGTPVEEIGVPYMMRGRGWESFFTGWRPVE